MSFWIDSKHLAPSHSSLFFIAPPHGPFQCPPPPLCVVLSCLLRYMKVYIDLFLFILFPFGPRIISCITAPRVTAITGT